MNINKEKIALSIVLILAIITAIVGIVFAVNDTTDTVETTKVSAVKDVENDKKINIKIESVDETEQNNKNSASITSFQIGLNVDVANDAGIKFTFNDKLNNATKKLADYNYDKENKKLYIYYTGEKELNDLQFSNTLEVGYITIDTTKETAVDITPIDGFSTASSIDFSETAFVSGDSAHYTISATNTNGSTGENPNGGQGGDSSGNQSGNQGGNSGSDQGQNGSLNGDSSQTSNNKTDETESTGDNKTIVDKLISTAKTGANHSIVRIVIPLIILIVVAFMLIYLKTRTKPRKH